MTPHIAIIDRENIGLDLEYGKLETLGSLTIHENLEPREVMDYLATAKPRILIANRTLFPREIIGTGAAHGLGLICLTATGFNTVDLEAAREHGVGVCNIVGYSTDAVAQHSFALVLSLANRLGDFHRWTVGKDWPAAGAYTNLALPYAELAGKRWGIAGYGAIGRRVASLARAFGCEVVRLEVSGVARQEDTPAVEKEEFFRTCDVVSIHAPINDRSRGLVGTRELALMKPRAILVNVGRGGIVDEAALATALDQGLLGGVGLDVLWPEPPAKDHPLLTDRWGPKLILTPHVAWAAQEARQRAVDEVGLNIAAWLAGTRRNRVD
jgi:lactate dehydrogenase-like 2-hydroxyacid dehydrogenase